MIVQARPTAALTERLRDRLFSPSTASLAGVVALLSLVGTLVMSVLVPSASDSWSASSQNILAGAGGILFALPFTVIGTLIARRQPHNPMGWLLIGVALAIELGTLAPSYAYLDYGRHGGSLPLGGLAVLLSGVWIFAFALLPLPILLFPNGRLTRRWRWPLRVYLLLAADLAVSTFVIAVGDLGLRLPVDDQGNLAGINHPGGWAGVAQGAGLAASLLLSVAAIARQVLSYRHATSERRQQLKWLSLGAATCLAAAVTAAAWPNPPGIVSNGAIPLGLAALPIAMGVGILRYRLYEIDRLISRTLAYAILTAMLAGTFIGLVALSTDTLALSGRVGVAASTLAAAALFNPLRVRVQRLVDRRFNRARYDAEAIVAAFTVRLRDAVELDAVRRDLLDAVQDAVQPEHATVWIRP
jgi:hypothetical protein